MPLFLKRGRLKKMSDTTLVYGYTKSGRVVHLIKEIKGGGETVGFLVCDIIVDDETDDEWADTDSPRFVRDLFKSPPQYKEDERKVALLNDINSLAIEKDRLLQDISDAKIMLESFKKIQQAQTLLNFLDKKITHVVVGSRYNLKIQTLEEALVCENYDRDLKLVSLFGRSKGDLEWNINQYYDGSGSNVSMIPCTSYEEARERLEGLLQEQVEEWRTVDNRTPNCSIIKTAAEYGIDLDEEYVKEYHALEVEKAEKNVTKTEKVLEEYRSNLGKLQEDLSIINSEK
jgi:hypothetical protein